jgi:hypothetical protein
MDHGVPPIVWFTVGTTLTVLLAQWLNSVRTANRVEAEAIAEKEKRAKDDEAFWESAVPAIFFAAA